MSTNGTAPHDVHQSHHAPEVVAGLVNDGSVGDVAVVAVRLARQSGSRVRLVQVLPEGMSPEDRSDVESTTFAVALRALHGRPRVQATFEYPAGDPGQVLVERSRGALALVVGQDDNPTDQGSCTARYCEEHAGCRVHVVCAAQEAELASLPRE